MQKLNEKSLKKSWKNWIAPLACNPSLTRRRSTKKPKGVLSVRPRAKHKISVKSKLHWAYKRSRKQKENTHRVLELSSE